MTEFVVSGKLQLAAGTFVSEAQKAATALRNVETASRSVGTGATAAASGTARQAAALDAAAAAAQRYKVQAQLGHSLNLQIASSTSVYTRQISGQAQAEDAAAAARARLNAALRATPKPAAIPPVPAPAPPPKPGPAPAPGPTAAGLTAQQKLMLGYQLNDVFTSAVGGMNPLMIAAQQGPQITQIFGGLSNTLRLIPPQAYAAAAAIALIAGPLAIGTARAHEMEAQHRQLAITLEATGRAAGLSARELQRLSDAEARRPGAGRQETAAATQQLLSNPLLSGDAFQRTLAVSRDLARVMGSDLASASQVVSQSLDGTYASARKLDQVLNVLTASELEQIRVFEEQGRKADVVGVMLGALERRLKGLNEQGVGPTSKAFAELRTSWNTFSDAVAGSWLVRNGRVFFATMAAAAIQTGRWIAEAGTWASGGPRQADGDALAQRRQELAAAEQKLKSLESQSGGGADLQKRIATARVQVYELRKDVQDLEGRAAKSTAQAQTDAARTTATQTDREVKETIEALEKRDTVFARRRQLEADVAKTQRVLDTPGLHPDTYRKAAEAIAQMRGELTTLRTAGEGLQRSLDLEAVLSKLPQHLQEANRAYLETKRAAAAAGKDDDEAERLAEQARRNALQQRTTDTKQQIENLSLETRAALAVADAYGRSQAEAIRTAAQLRAQIAEKQGSIAPGTAGQVADEELRQQAADAVRAAAEKNYAYRLEVEALERVAAAERVSSEAAREAERANRVAAVSSELRAFAASQSSDAVKVAAEREIAVYDRLTQRQLAVDRAREANAVNRQYDPAVAYAQEIARLKALEAQGLLTARAIEEAMKEANLRWLQSSRDATDGAIYALKRYADEATNAGKSAAEGVQKGLTAIEDGVVQIVTTGKISFTGMVNSWIADIVRMTTRQYITGPLSGLLGGLLGRLFGRGGNIEGFAGGGGDGNIEGFSHHRGGIVGRDGAARTMPAIAWLDAQRFHGGGTVGLRRGERPIIALDGEEVLTADDPRHRRNLGRAGAGGPAVQVNVINNAQAQVGVRERTNADGSIGVDVIIEQLEGRLANNVVRGNSQLGEAMEGTYGLQRAGRRM